MAENSELPTGFWGFLNNLWGQIILTTLVTVVWLVWIIWEITLKGPNL